MTSNNKFFTCVTCPTSKFNISNNDKICSLGSCFSENISQYLKNRLIDIIDSPFGTIYNPITLFDLLTKALQKHTFDKTDLIQTDSGFTTFYHHSKFLKSNPEEFITQANHNIEKFREHLLSANILFITLGSAYYFKHNQKIVNNCHKQKPSQFERQLATVEEIQNKIQDSISILHALNPNIKIIWSISPIRYTQSGGLENFLSKSILRCSVEPFLKLINCEYFPSYEILTDELRDYRFYDHSMTHPTALAIEEICTRFSKVFFDLNTLSIIENWEKLLKQWEHFNHNEFEAKKLDSLKNLKNKIIDFGEQNSINPNILKYFTKHLN